MFKNLKIFMNIFNKKIENNYIWFKSIIESNKISIYMNMKQLS